MSELQQQPPKPSRRWFQFSLRTLLLLITRRPRLRWRSHRMDIFGSTDPALMPPHFFWGAKRLAYQTAILADIDKQNYTVAPRHWYVDAEILCEACGDSFVFSASEQKAWYEEYQFFVYSFPRKCVTCRRAARHVKNLRREYDAKVSEALTTDDEDIKKALVKIIDALEEGGAPLECRIQENRKRLLRQLS